MVRKITGYHIDPVKEKKENVYLEGQYNLRRRSCIE